MPGCKGVSRSHQNFFNGLIPEGTFFDCAVVHLLTTATLDRLQLLYPPGRFEVRRFRPNMVVATGNGEKDFVENGGLREADNTSASGARLRHS